MAQGATKRSAKETDVSADGRRTDAVLPHVTEHDSVLICAVVDLTTVDRVKKAMRAMRMTSLTLIQAWVCKH